MVELLTKQKELVEADEREILQYGGRGGGKTTALIAWLHDGKWREDGPFAKVTLPNHCATMDFADSARRHYPEMTFKKHHMALTFGRYEIRICTPETDTRGMCFAGIAFDGFDLLRFLELIPDLREYHKHNRQRLRHSQRAQRKRLQARVVITVNPPLFSGHVKNKNEFNWVFDRFIANPPKDVRAISTTVADNEFLAIDARYMQMF